MIIVEGPDGAGKSTLVARLCEQFEIGQGERGTTDRSRLWEVTVPDTFNALKQCVEGRDQVKIWDRLFYSEMVYHDLVGRTKCEFNDAQQSVIRAVIDALECPVILCLPPLDVVLANVADSEQMDGVKERIRAIYDRYVEMYAHGIFPADVILYDYTGTWPDGGGIVRLEQEMASQYQTPAQIAEHIGDYINYRKERAW